MKLELNYNYLLLILSFLSFCLFTSTGFVVFFLVLIILPGYIITDIFLGKAEIAIKLIVSFGTGISFVSLVVYLFSLLKIPLNAISIFLTLSLLVLGYLFLNRENLKCFDVDFKRDYSLKYIILTLILILGFFTRLYPIMGMNAPPFADSAVAGTISKLILTHQGIPDSWQPFLNIALNRPPGFPSNIATISIFSRLTIPKIVLFFTSTFHALLPLSIFLLASFVFKNDLKSYISALITLASAYPAYLFLWGVAGCVIIYFLLPIAFFLFLRSRERGYSLKNLSPLLLIISGGCLIHPYMIFFVFLFWVSYYFVFSKKSIDSLKSSALNFLTIIVIPLIIVLPYYLSSLGSSAQYTVKSWNIQANSINPLQTLNPYLIVEPIFFLFENPFGDLFFPLAQISVTDFLFRYPFGLLFSLIFIYSLFIIYKRREKFGFIFLLLYFLFILFGPVQAALKLKFPFWYLIYPSRLKYIIVLPLSLILPYGFTQGVRTTLKQINLEKVRKMTPALILLLIFLPFGVLTIKSRMSEISELKGISDKDMRNINWIKKNTEDEEVVLNLIDDVEAGAFVGGPGQWITSLTGNKVIFPATSVTGNFTKVKERTKFMDMIGRDRVTSKEFLSLLDRYNVSYIFTSGNTPYKLGHLLTPPEFSEVSDPHEPDYVVEEGCNKFENKYFKKIRENSDSCIFKVKENEIDQ